MGKQKPAEPGSDEKSPRTKGRPKLSNPKGRARVVMTVRASAEWEAWIDSACDALRQQTGLGKVDRTDAMDVAFSELATRLGISTPPARY